MSDSPLSAAFQPPRFGHQWYLREWMLERGKRQKDMMQDLGWSRGKANEVANGQQYTQALIDELAPWLQVEPFELLLPPNLAKSLRAMKASAAAIVAETSGEFRADGLEDLASTGAPKVAG